MNTFITYIIATVVSLGIFYSAYILLLRKEALFRFNRIYLLTGLLLSYLVPLISLLPVSFFRLFRSSDNDGILRTISLAPVEISATAVNNPSIVNYIVYVYIAGLVFFAIRLITRGLSIYHLHRESEKTHSNNKLILWSKKDIPPFSFFRTIYLPVSLKDTHQVNEIIRHEQLHISSLHSFDILFTQLLQIVFWFNPFIPLVEDALREIHEFEADKAVIQSGTDPVTYTRILFGQDKAAQAIILGNNFNYSLIKRRLTMFYKKSTRYARLKAAIVLPLAVCTVMLYTVGCNQSAKNDQAENSDSLTEATQKVVMLKDSAGNEIGTATTIGDEGVPPPPPPPPPPPTKQKTAGEDELFMVVETMPQFPGGEDARVRYMVENIKYPEQAKEKGIQGTVYVSFVVEKNGSITNPKIIRSVEKSLDAEAFRVISAMPKWIPGSQKGKPVRVQFNMPIKFKLDN